MTDEERVLSCQRRSEDFGVWSGSMKKKEDCFLHGWKRKAKYRLKTRLD